MIENIVQLEKPEGTFEQKCIYEAVSHAKILDRSFPVGKQNENALKGELTSVSSKQRVGWAQVMHIRSLDFSLSLMGSHCSIFNKKLRVLSESLSPHRKGSEVRHGG